MTVSPLTYGDVDGFVAMLQAACEDSNMNDTLQLLLSQPDHERKAAVSTLLDRLRTTGTSQSLIKAMACLLDDDVAERAYEVIYHCSRKAN